MKKRVLSLLLCLVMALSLIPTTALAWDTETDCEFCGRHIADSWICDCGGHCSEETGDDCYERNHCADCGDAVGEDNLCDDCHMCDDCAIAAGLHCECCGEHRDDLCPNCGWCADCGYEYHCPFCGACYEVVDYCEYHGMCIDCAMDYGDIHCPGCGACGDEVEICEYCGYCDDCAQDEGFHCSAGCGACMGEGISLCDSCGMCYDCGGQCSEGDDHLCLACHFELDPPRACSDCGKCFVDDNSDQCMICGRCLECGGGQCKDGCEDICLECHLDGEGACPDCHKCYLVNGGDDHRCPNCDLCDECEDWCDTCKMHNYCAADEGKHCPVCGTCYFEAGDWCDECGRCYECTEKCDACSDELGPSICVECAADAGYHCSNCETCYFEAGDWCDECGRCYECVDKCEACSDELGNSICVECAADAGYHCSDCGACCFAVEDWCDACGMCVECAMANGSHCPDCGNCFDDVGEPCYKCGICWDCIESEGLHCPTCYACGAEYELCTACGEECSYCSDIYCDYCEMSVACAIDAGLHCGNCEECGTLETICPECGEACTSCWAEAWCYDCGMCLDCAINGDLHCPECENCYEDVAKCETGNHCVNCCDCAAKCAAPKIAISNNASTGKPRLSWAKVDGAAKYEVYRATSKTGTYSKLTTTSNLYLNNTSAVAGTTYYYKVRALDSKGVASEYSNIVYITCDCAKPVVKVSANSSGKPYLTWAKVDGATSYEIYYATSAGGEFTKLYTTSNLYLNHNSAEAGKTYYYKVVALSSKSSYATSAYSDVVSFTCKSSAPAAPSISISNNASTGKPRLSWKAVSGATQYEVYRATSKTGEYTKLTTTSNLYLNNTSAVAGTTYYYKVRALNAGGTASEYSNLVYITCDCAKPVVSVKLNSSNHPYLSWAKVDGATSYEIYYATSANGEFTKLYTTSNLYLNHNSAKAGTTYYYKVLALSSKSSYATSAYSDVVSIQAK